MASANFGRTLCRSRVLGSKFGVYANIAFPNNVRHISTSEKAKESIVIRPTIKDPKLVYEESEYTDTGFSKVNPKNWVSWGPSDISITEDRTTVHLIFLWLVTGLLTGGFFLYMYMPDFMLRDWARREAFLELRRREALGLPQLNGELVPLARITLPTDEEIRDVDVNV